MNRTTIVLLGAGGLIVAFGLAVYVYQSQQAAKFEAAAHNAPPYVRDYSQSLGPEDARVVLVEFFDPGCETCRAFAEPVKKLVESHAGRVRLVLRYAAFHQGSDTMVKALEAAPKASSNALAEAMAGVNNPSVGADAGDEDEVAKEARSILQFATNQRKEAVSR